MAKARPADDLITHERLLELVSYDPESGIFTLKIRRRKYPVGHVLGTAHHTGYTLIKLDQIEYQASRLAVFYMTGIWPEHLADHRNRRRSNNFWTNIRPANFSQNRMNSIGGKNSGAKGVYLRKRKNWKPVWVAQIKEPFGKVIHLGHFPDRNSASKAYQAAAEKLFGEFARS